MITISDSAAQKIKDILKVEGLPGHGLRIMASGGGCCGGSQYEIMIDEKAGAGDTVVEKDGAKVFFDAATATALAGVELGFQSEEGGEGFVMNFPKGGGGCGCGPDQGGGCGPGGGSPGGCGCR